MKRANGALGKSSCSGTRPCAPFVYILLCIAAVAIIASHPASAAPCSDPDGVEGEMVYNTTHKVAQFCNGTHWISMAAGSVSGDSDTLSGLSCASGEIPKWNGSAWTCASDGGGSSQWTTTGNDIYYNTGGVTVGGTTVADNTSVLDLRSTTKGFLPPRMTTVQRNAIASPATGLVVYDTDLNALYIRTSSGWNSLGGSGTGRAASGTFSFAHGNCTTAAGACTVDISSAGFSGTPVCTVSMTNNDGSGYSEHMVVQSVTATTLKVWKGQYLANGTTMSGNWVCIQGAGSLGAGGGSSQWTTAGSDIYYGTGNVGIGTTGAPSGYALGGTPRILEIQNPGTTLHSQSDVMFSTGANLANSWIGVVGASALNSSAGIKSVAYMGMRTGPNYTEANPTGIVEFATRGPTDSTWTGRVFISETGTLSVGNNTPNDSAILQADSTTKGFLPPRMTTVQRNAIASPATGLTIYNTTTNSLDFFNGTVWSSGALTSLPGSKGLSISGTVTSASATTFNVSAVTTNTLLGSNPASSTITIPEAGNYFMTAVQNTCTGGANGYGSVTIKVNGTIRRSANSMPNSCDSATVALYAVLAAGDTVAAECGQNNAVSTTCYFDIAKLQSDTALGGGGSSQWTDVTGGINYAGGKVGVGTASPLDNLSVNSTSADGRLAFGFIDNEQPATLSSLSSSFGGALTVNMSGGNGEVDLINRWANTNAGAQGFSFIQQTGTGTFSNLMTIDGDSGYVGIGTTTPDQLVHVLGGSTYRGLTSSVLIDNSLPGIMFEDSQTSEAAAITSDTGELRFYTRNASGNFAGGDLRMTIQNTGNVGIGTTSAVNKLSVVGGADTWASTFYGLSTSDSVRIGTLGGVATIGANNNAGNAWATLSINPGGNTVFGSTTGNVGIGTATPAATALLDVTSTTKGFLPPRMTTVQRDAIASPAEGLVVYNTTSKSLDLRVASSWLSFGGSMTGNTMFSGWPDAIACNITTPANNGVRILNLAYAPHTSNVYIYRAVENSAERIYMQMAFSAAGAFSSFTYNNGSALAVTSDCDNKSIATLYSEGKAFNFVGGSTASADGTAGQVQFNEGGNLKADAALHWDNVNKRLGIGTTAPASQLHVFSNAGWTQTIGQAATGYQVRLSLNAIGAFSNNAASTLSINPSGGNVGIGTAAPAVKLQIDAPGTNNHIILKNTAGGPLWGISNDGSSLVITNGAPGVNGTGVWLANGGQSWSAISDRTLKTDVTALSVLERLKDYRAVSYVFKPSGKREIGVIAQELQALFPELVAKAPGGLLGVSYDRLGAIALEGVKELKADNDDLRAQLKAANDNYEELRREIDALKAAR